MTETTPRKVHRRSDDRIIAGVSSGLADYFNIDTILIRLIWVALFFLTAGIPTVLVYLLAWWLIPDTEGTRSSTPLIWLVGLIILIILPVVAGLLFMSFVTIVSVETSSFSLLLPLLVAA